MTREGCAQKGIKMWKCLFHQLSSLGPPPLCAHIQVLFNNIQSALTFLIFKSNQIIFVRERKYCKVYSASTFVYLVTVFINCCDMNFSICQKLSWRHRCHEKLQIDIYSNFHVIDLNPTPILWECQELDTCIKSSYLIKLGWESTRAADWVWYQL